MNGDYRGDDDSEIDPRELERRHLEKMETPLEKFSHTAPVNTLDQSTGQTLVRQMKGVCIKFSYVLIPRSPEGREKWIRDWDLWGPFLLCLLFVFFIDNQSTFLTILFSVFLGAAVVAFNTRALGGHISFLQSIAILGYCILPLLLAVLVLRLMKFLQFENRWVRIGFIVVAVIWSIFAAKSFIAANIVDGKKLVALFPIMLFYSFLGLLLAFTQ